MSPGRLRALALGLALLLAACGKVELNSGLGENEANDMLAALLRHGIPAEKQAGAEGTFVVLVPQDRFAEAVDMLRMEGLPRAPFASLGEVFKKEGLISSPLEERVRLIYALSQELSATLSEIDGVLGARVHVVLPDNALSVDRLVPSSASVFIRHKADAPVEQLTPQIKMLVTNSIEGLSYDKVSVILFPVEVPASLEREASLVDIGPIRVDPLTTTPFWVIVGGLGFLAVLGLAGTGALGFLLLRQRRLATAGTATPAKAGPGGAATAPVPAAE